MDLTASPSLSLILARLSNLRATSPPDEAEQVQDELLSLAAIYDLDLGDDDDDDDDDEDTRDGDGETGRSALRLYEGGNLVEGSKEADDPLRVTLTTTIPPSTNPSSTTIGPKTSTTTRQSKFNLLISIPRQYPRSEPPQIQLQSLYVGGSQGRWSVSDELFGAVVRTFMHEHEHGHSTTTTAGVEGAREGSARRSAPIRQATGVEFIPGNVCLFEGVESVRELVRDWVDERDKERWEREVERESQGVKDDVYAVRGRDDQTGAAQDGEGRVLRRNEDDGSASPRPQPPRSPCPRIVSTEGLLDRKSLFVGHAAQVDSVEQVRIVLATLLENSKIAKATHNIYAYRFHSPAPAPALATPTSSSSTTPATRTSILHSDNFDDGESGAGARLAHLLELVPLRSRSSSSSASTSNSNLHSFNNKPRSHSSSSSSHTSTPAKHNANANANASGGGGVADDDKVGVLVVVSRWYGGIHLGADRFKDINVVARDALKLGGFLVDGIGKT